MKIIIVIGFAILMACIVAVAVFLNRKIDALDNEVFMFMKEEHNARMEDYIPRDYYNKVVEELCHKHTEDCCSCKKERTE